MTGGEDYPCGKREFFSRDYSAFFIASRARYSGYYYASTTYEYATVMLYGLSFQKVLLRCLHATT